VPVLDDAGNVVLDHDEYPRPGTTLEGLAELKPAFGAFLDMPSGPGEPSFGGLINQVYPDIKIEPVHHAGTSSGNVDGASALLLASQPAMAKHGLKPRARIVAMANHAEHPTLMLTAPSGAVTKVLAKAGLTKDQIDVWEIIGATGAILVGTALDELERSGGRYGLITMCTAGGMAPALIIERV
jgi:acetyl-CoA C-acetyltransferase